MKINGIGVHLTNIDLTILNLKRAIIALKEEKRIEYKNFILTSIGTYLGNIYNGLEFIFNVLLKRKGKVLKKTEYWHKNLLEEIKKSKIINKGLINKLDNYRKFRHFWFHNYAHLLKEKELNELAEEIINIYDKLYL